MKTTRTYTEPTPSTPDVPRWILELEPIQPPRNPERALALALKRLRRRDGLRVVSVRRVDQEGGDDET